MSLHETSCEGLLKLSHIFDYTMPDIKKKFKGWNEASGKNKLSDFAKQYWHYDTISYV